MSSETFDQLAFLVTQATNGVLSESERDECRDKAIALYESFTEEERVAWHIRREELGL